MTSNSSHDYLLKLVLVGDSMVGKTCLLLRYTDDTFSEAFLPTIGVDFKIKNRVTDGVSLKIQLWDTAGQDRFKSIVSSFYRGADGLAVVFDVTNMESFENVTQWMQEAEHYGNNPRCLKLLIGNKCDKLKERVVSTQQAQELADRLQVRYIETSAKASYQVHQALDQLADTIVKTYREEGIVVEVAGSSGGRRGQDTIRMSSQQVDAPGYWSYCVYGCNQQ